MDKKKLFRKTIEENIKNFSYHVTVVKQSEVPRYAYTIGIREKFNFELIIAGNENFIYEDILSIINLTYKSLDNEDIRTFKVRIPKLGTFKLSKVHSSWIRKMMLGVYDYYNIDVFDVYQIVPDVDHYSLDVPDMSMEWICSEQPIWKWLDDDIEWDFKVPKNAKIITDIDALFGKRITEVMRWENDEWEGFTINGDEIDKDSIRVISIATIVGIDNSMLPILTLNIGKGLWRDSEVLQWNNWG